MFLVSQEIEDRVNQFKSWVVYASAAAEISFTTHAEPPFPPLAGAAEGDSPRAEGTDTSGESHVESHVGEGGTLIGGWETVPTPTCADSASETTEEAVQAANDGSPETLEVETWELVEAAQAKPGEVLEGLQQQGSGDVDTPQATASGSTSSLHTETSGTLDELAEAGIAKGEAERERSGPIRLATQDASNAGSGEEHVACACGELCCIYEPAHAPAEGDRVTAVAGNAGTCKGLCCNEDDDWGSALCPATREVSEGSVNDGDGPVDDLRETSRSSFLLPSERDVATSQGSGGTPGVTAEVVREVLREYADRPDVIRLRSGRAGDGQREGLWDGANSENNILPVASKLLGGQGAGHAPTLASSR